MPVFGSTVYADFYEYRGPAPSGHDPSDGTPIYELALLKGSVPLHQLFPELSTSAFAHIVISNVMIAHQTALFDKTKAVGWSLEGDLTIGTETGGLYDILSKVLSVEGPLVHLRARLGDSHDRSWSSSTTLHNLALEGTLITGDHSLSEGLIFSQLGVRLLATGGALPPPPEHSDPLSYGYEVLGRMHLTFPSTSVPTEFKFNLVQGQDGLNLTATPVDSVWKDALGIPGLNVRGIWFWREFC